MESHNRWTTLGEQVKATADANAPFNGDSEPVRRMFNETWARFTSIDATPTQKQMDDDPTLAGRIAAIGGGYFGISYRISPTNAPAEYILSRDAQKAATALHRLLERAIRSRQTDRRKL